jgi:hypothetical protein
MKHESGLELLKKEYGKLEKKYSLPKFKFLNEDFDIERISEKETDFVLREARKAIMDKVLAYLRFTELLLNPQSAPMFFFSLIKSLNPSDKNLVERIYKKIAEYELEVIGLDNIYSEKKEAEFIKKIHREWQEIKKDVDELVQIMNKNWKQKSKKIEREYFG